MNKMVSKPYLCATLEESVYIKIIYLQSGPDLRMVSFECDAHERCGMHLNFNGGSPGSKWVGCEHPESPNE